VPIATSDLSLYYSVSSAAAGFTTAGSPASSLGGYLSTSPVVDAVLDNLFPDVTGDENAAQNVDYKCVFLVNNHATLTLQRTVVWIESEVAGGANMSYAADQKGQVPKAQVALQAATIASKQVAPTAVSAFSTGTTKAAGLPVGDIPPGACVALWLKRTNTNSAAQYNDAVSVKFEGDTSQ
jgi:hypothetical protein